MNGTYRVGRDLAHGVQGANQRHHMGFELLSIILSYSSSNGDACFEDVVAVTVGSGFSVHWFCHTGDALVNIW